jgi:hypothetical protein
VKILNFILEDFYLEDKLPVEVAKSFDKDKIQLEFNVGMNLDTMKKTIAISLNTNFFAEEERKNNVGHINTKSTFELANIDDIIAKTEGKLPNTILASLIGVTLSTTRGVFLIKSEKTFMDGAMIPMMNPMSFFSTPPTVEQIK